MWVMQDATIDNALLALRKQMILENGEGRDHVEALLQIRGVRLPRVLGPKAANTVRKWHMAYMILEAIRARPMTLKELVAHLAHKRPDVPQEMLYWRTASALNKLRVKGLVLREGQLWHAFQ